MSSLTKQGLHLPGWIHDILERRLDGDIELPILPEASAKVIALCEDENSDAKAIEKKLERDPSMAAHVLRLANSTAYAPTEQIVSLQQAVSRLGVGVIRNIVLAMSLHGRVFKIPGHQTRVRAIWIHCVVAAGYGREIARRLRQNTEAAFLCGLLHDVGRPIVLQATIDALAHRSKQPLPSAFLETAMDEFHEGVGGRLTSSWKLADWTGAVVENHHHPERAQPHEKLAEITYLADLLSDWALEDSKGPEDFAADDPVIESLGLSSKDIEALLDYRGKALELSEVF